MNKLNIQIALSGPGDMVLCETCEGDYILGVCNQMAGLRHSKDDVEVWFGDISRTYSGDSTYFVRTQDCMPEGGVLVGQRFSSIAEFQDQFSKYVF